MNERGVEYAVLGRPRWSLAWDEILAVQAYAKPEGAYRLGFRIESSGRDAELNTRDDALSKSDIVDAFRAIAAAARRRGIEVGDPLGWLPEPEESAPGRDPRITPSAGGGKWYLSREPRRLALASLAGAALACVLALGILHPGIASFAGGPEELAMTVLLVGLGTAIAVPAASADAISALRLDRHGIGVRSASRREVIVRWPDVVRLELSPADGLLALETADTRRRAARLGEMDCREIAAWLAANRLCEIEIVEARGEPAQSPTAAANSSDIS